MSIPRSGSSSSSRRRDLVFVVNPSVGNWSRANGRTGKEWKKLLPYLRSRLGADCNAIREAGIDVNGFLTVGVSALGAGFSPFAEPVFQRCISIIQSQQVAKVDPVSSGVQYDKEFIVCSLDLLSGLAEGLGSGIESLVSQSNLKDLLLNCCMDDASDVRQSGFALLGDLARVCPIHLRPRLPEFLDAAAEQLNTPKLKETISVANNAYWAIGELAVKWGRRDNGLQYTQDEIDVVRNEWAKFIVSNLV